MQSIQNKIGNYQECKLPEARARGPFNNSSPIELIKLIKAHL